MFQFVEFLVKKRFQIMQEVPIKTRRKKVDVEVHKSDSPSIRTFSANYPAVQPVQSSRKSKHRVKSEDLTEEEKLNERVSKRHLVKENEKLNNEIKALQEKLTSMEMYIDRKNNKFKEKLCEVQNVNEELSRENLLIKSQYQEILAQFKGCQNELEVARNCQKCEELNIIIQKQTGDVTNLKKSNFELIEDVNMLKNVVYRLNVQLERYQQKLHKSNLSFSHSQNIPKPTNSQTTTDTTSILSQTHRGHSHTAISWGNVNAHTLGPLLDAYQDSINEKDDIIQQYEDQLSIFTEKMREIIKENENLHKQLIEDDDSSHVLSGEVEKLKEEVKSLKEQNDLLIKKCALKQDKVEEILKCYEQKVEQMKRDYKVLHDEYCKNRTEIAALKEKNKGLLEEKDDFRSERQQYIPLSVHNASVNECKKWYEELKQQYEKEKVKLKEDIEALNKQLTEGAEKIVQYKKERDENELKIKAAEKQIKKLETKYLDLQHTLNEVQLSGSACRKQLHKAMSFARELVSEQETLLKALNQRHKENKAVKKIGSDIATRMDSLKHQLKTVQQEAYLDLSSVEQKLQQKDSLINTLKKQHSLEIENLKKIIAEKEEKSILLRAASDSSIPLPHYLLFREKTMSKT